LAAGVFVDGRTELIRLLREIVSMDRDILKIIFARGIPFSQDFGNVLIFMNARLYRAVVDVVLEEHTTERISGSLNCNPIEYMWDQF
jgi:hypothetical protein